MARFIITMCDTNSGEIRSFFFRHQDANYAILQHPWILDTYKESYIDEMFYHEDAQQVIQNIWSQLSWAVAVVNLDEETMKDLNGGDSSVSSSQQQE